MWKGGALVADQSQINLDAAQFLILCDSQDPSNLNSAYELYRGSFLDGYSLRDTDFDQWVLAERSHLQQHYLFLLQRLVDNANICGDAERAILLSNRMLAIDPLQEPIHRVVIRHYLQLGQRKSALAQFNSCCSLLRDELGIEPDAQTQELGQEIRQQQMRQDKTALDENTPDPAADAEFESTLSSPFVATHAGVSQAGVAAETVPPVMHHQPTTLPRSSTTRQALRQIKPGLLIGAVVLLWICGSLLQMQLFERAAEPGNNHVSVPEIPRDTTVLVRGHSATTKHIEPTMAPILVVLPFRNLNTATDSRYFTDGLTEDLITDLSRLSGIRVVSSATSFAYRDSSPMDVEIRRKLEADYVVEGSVRRVGDHLRINIRLMDTGNNTNLWAQRYDHSLADIFRTQGHMIRGLIDALPMTPTLPEQALLMHDTATDPRAYDLLLRGLSPLREFSGTGIKSARTFFLQALEIEPDYARARANLALSYGREVVFRLARFQPEAITRGLAEADKAESLDPTLPQTEFARGVLHLAGRNHQQAVAASRRAIQLDKSYADGYAVLAQTAAYAGILPEALAAIRKAKSLDPNPPFSYLWVEGHILYQLGQYDDALPLLEHTVERNPAFLLGLMTLTANYGQLQMYDEADWQNQEILTLNPAFSAITEGKTAPYKYEKHREHYIDGLLKAGLPE